MKLLDEFRLIIGENYYESFINLFKEIGPQSRTHRISVVMAGILRFGFERIDDHYEEGSLAEALIVVDEEPCFDSEEWEKVLELVDEICREAGMRNVRITSRGHEYSIAESVISEYCR